MIGLKPLRGEEIQRIRKWRNENREYFIDQEYISKKAQERWFKSYKKQGTKIVFVIYAYDRPIGTVSVDNKPNEYGDIEIGNVLIGEKADRGHGLMQGTFKQLSSIYTGKKFYLRVLRNNLKAISSYLKFGFKQVAETKDILILSYDNSTDSKL